MTLLYQICYQANWELVILSVCNLPVKDELMNMNMKIMNRRKMEERPSQLFTQLKQLLKESVKNFHTGLNAAGLN